MFARTNKRPGFKGLIAGILAILFVRSLGTTAAYPLRDPRLKESLTSHELPATEEAPASH